MQQQGDAAIEKNKSKNVDGNLRFEMQDTPTKENGKVTIQLL